MTQCCDKCGQKVRRLNPHHICKSKVEMLEILAKAGGYIYVDSARSATIDGEVKRVPYRAQSLCSVLVWFGLVEREGHRSGHYKITDAGLRYLRGEHMVPATIWSRDGEIVETDQQMTSITSVKDVKLDKEYWDNYWKLQKDAA